MNVNLIVAVDEHTMGIGYNGSIPWKNNDDMKWFKEVTTGEGNNAVVMGRTTYESIGKPLLNRINIVLTHNTEIQIEGCIVVNSLSDAITEAKNKKCDSLFIIGGSSIYKQAMDEDIVDIVYIDYLNTGLTHNNFDKYFDITDTILSDKFAKSMLLTNMYADYNYKNTVNINVYYRLRTRNETDAQYLRLINDILTTGQTKHTRAGDTLSVFGRMLSFDLRQGLPILTSKKVYAKGCIHELLWILHGNTNIKYLVENNTHIWDDDAYRYYLQKFENTLPTESRMKKETFLENVLVQHTISYTENNNKLTYTYGDLGPVYGKQWVNWNGINQVEDLINKLKNNPDDRRLMISAWNVGEIKDMALPPCHYLSQFYVANMSHYDRCVEYAKKTNTEVNLNLKDSFLDNNNIPTKFLSCMWMQRSVDTCLGLPYDLLSYSILTHLIAQVCNMVPYEIKCSLGDTHIYKNQIDGAIKQLMRNPFKYEYATLSLNKDIKDINDFKYEDIKINNYNSYSVVKYPLSVGL